MLPVGPEDGQFSHMHGYQDGDQRSRSRVKSQLPTCPQQ